LALDEMAFGTPCSPEKKRFAIAWIARNQCTLRFSLKQAEILHQGVDSGGLKSGEGRHPRLRDTVMNDTKNPSVGLPLHVRLRRNIWSALSAPSIEAMARGAPGLESAAAFGG
jgi:hypothetical protein